MFLLVSYHHITNLLR